MPEDPYVEANFRPPSPDYVTGPEEPEAGTTFARLLRTGGGYVVRNPRRITVDYPADGGRNGDDEEGGIKRYRFLVSWITKVGESSSAAAARPARGLRADYGFVLYGIGQDTDDVYMRLDDEQSQRQLLASRLNMRSMDASDLACGEVMSLRTTVLGQMSEIRELYDADRRRQAVTSEMLKADHRSYAVSTERGDSTTGTGDHLAGAGDSPTGTGGSIIGIGHITTGTGYRTIGTAGTRWRSCTARAARGGW
ncbi:hypothetical protein Tco_0817155 [Tanacetum coccineum]